MFNAERLYERMQARELETKVIRQGPAPRKAGQPKGTLSQIVRYLDHSRKSVAVVHQYLRPDGTLGASGRPDPKAVMKDGVLHVLTKPGG